MGEFNCLDNNFKHTGKFTAPFQKSKKCLQIAKCCHYYLCSWLPSKKASTYPKIFWGMVPWGLKSNLRQLFFHIHLHAIALMKQILLTSSSPGDAMVSTYMEGNGVTTILMQANLIFQGTLDFYLPKCFGVYSQNSKNCKFPCIAFINRLGKKWENFLYPTWA